jgi:hypothetical protein
MPKSKQVINEFNTPQIGYVIEQYDTKLAENIINLNKKKKVFTDLIWIKFLKSYRIDLYTQYDELTIKNSIVHILKHFIEDDTKICDTLKTL